jgi:hypothetical protein
MQAKQQKTLPEQLKAIEDKMQMLSEMVMRLKADNIALVRENTQLTEQLETQLTNKSQENLPEDQEQSVAQINQAKKIKREVEQTLRDAERRLEALRF